MAKKTSNPFFTFLATNYLSLGFLVAFLAFTGSLVLSEILKLPPCELCWFQRVAMYPQALLFGIALWKNDKSVVQYVLPLSIIGLVIAVYHYIGQLNPLILPCTNQAVSCADKQIELLGFITIPFMSGVAFLAIIILSLVYKKYANR